MEARNCPSAAELRSVSVQCSSLPFCPGGPVASSQVSLGQLPGHSCPGGCMWALHVMLCIPVSKINCFLGTTIYQLDVFTMREINQIPPAFGKCNWVSGRGWGGTGTISMLERSPQCHLRCLVCWFLLWSLRSPLPHPKHRQWKLPLKFTWSRLGLNRELLEQFYFVLSGIGCVRILKHRH